MSYIETAYREICGDSQQPQTWYVALCTNERRYGGPEEGGWYYDHSTIIEYQAFASESVAREVRALVEARAQELTKESQRADSQAMADSLIWLENRGLEADYLPEPNGPEEYYVIVTTELPVYDNSKPRYE